MSKKHYDKKELMDKFNELSDKEKVEILLKALSYELGSKEHRIFSAMGYSYSDAYDVPTYTKS